MKLRVLVHRRVREVAAVVRLSERNDAVHPGHALEDGVTSPARHEGQEDLASFQHLSALQRLVVVEEASVAKSNEIVVRVLMPEELRSRRRVEASGAEDFVERHARDILARPTIA